MCNKDSLSLIQCLECLDKFNVLSVVVCVVTCLADTPIFLLFSSLQFPFMGKACSSAVEYLLCMGFLFYFTIYLDEDIAEFIVTK